MRDSSVVFCSAKAHPFAERKATVLSYQILLTARYTL
jgi:hypothetical protein